MVLNTVVEPCCSWDDYFGFANRCERMKVIKLSNDTANVCESEEIVYTFICFMADGRPYKAWLPGTYLLTVHFNCIRYNIVPMRISVYYQLVKAKLIRYALFLCVSYQLSTRLPDSCGKIFMYGKVPFHFGLSDKVFSLSPKLENLPFIGRFFPVFNLIRIPQRQTKNCLFSCTSFLLLSHMTTYWANLLELALATPTFI